MNAETTAGFDKAKLYITYCDGIGCNASTRGALEFGKAWLQRKGTYRRYRMVEVRRL
jgi:hypothetical protein